MFQPLQALLKFLRHNSRHSLWFPRGSKYGKGKLFVLNPISSSSHNDANPPQRTWTLDEPYRIFRLRQRLFAFSGSQRCGRRGDWDQVVTSARFNGHKPLPDTWDLGPDGNRTCSYCGSIHPDDLMEICKKVVDNKAGYGIEGTTKSYKVYVRQPSVRNASEGAIKFYTQHGTNMTSEQQELLRRAARLSHERYLEEFKQQRAS